MIRLWRPLSQEMPGGGQPALWLFPAKVWIRSFIWPDEQSNKMQFQVWPSCTKVSNNSCLGTAEMKFQHGKVLGSLWKTSRKQFRCQSEEPWALNSKIHLFQIVDGSQIMPHYNQGISIFSSFFPYIHTFPCTHGSVQALKCTWHLVASI